MKEESEIEENQIEENMAKKQWLKIYSIERNTRKRKKYLRKLENYNPWKWEEEENVAFDIIRRNTVEEEKKSCQENIGKKE